VIDPSRTELRVQRDGISQEWRERFIKDHGDPNVIDSPDLLARSL
jgi:hypothetical protein